MTIVLNGTTGITSPGGDTGAADFTINGLTVGKGGGGVSSNTVVGNSVLTGGSVTGSSNTGIGFAALQSISSGYNNTGVGVGAGNGITTGLYNNVFGTNALNNTTTGSYNSAFGSGALQNNTTASNNTAVGYQAGYSITTGTSNVCLGYGAGYNITTGFNNIIIGLNSNPNAASDTNTIVIGAAIGGKGSNTGFLSPNGGGVYQGNNSSSWSTTSDQRLKKNIVDNTVGLDAINKIQVRNFEYRTADEVTDLPKEQAIDIKGVQLGAIAQELALVLPDCVKTESTGVMSVDASNITWHLINAVKELSAEVNALKAKLGA